MLLRALKAEIAKVRVSLSVSQMPGVNQGYDHAL
jgi:hypothetical protein